MTFQHIVASLDESALGLPTFQQALALATTYGAKLHLLHVLRPLSPTLDLGAEAAVGGMSDLGHYPLFPDPELWDAQVQSQQTQAQAWLTSYLEQARQSGILVEQHLPVGEIGPSICEVSQQLQADLIVIGRRGLSGFAEAIMGSVSNYVTHHAPCSVLVVQAIAQKAHA